MIPRSPRGSVSTYHIGNSSPAFVSNMRRLLQVRAAKHYSLGKKRGKIAASRMYRVGLPPIDGGEWNSRVFKTKTSETDLQDTAAFILTDASGSMSGSKYVASAHAAQLINDAFARVLHVPIKIAAFSSFGETPVIGMMKDWNEVVSADKMAERYHKFSGYMSGNNDADVVLWAYRDLLTRKEKRKVLIVCSDGSPADGIGDPVFALKSVVEQITKEGRVDLYGLGIMDTNVKRFYPKHVVIRDSSELESALVDLMGKALS